MINYKLVETITKQNIKLYGFLKSNRNNKCILFIPGLAGNIFDTPFDEKLSKECLKNNYDFLYSHNQGSFQIMNVPYLNEEGVWKSKLKGAAYENFFDSEYDIDSWIKYIINNNYEEIVIIAHSLGCNKLVNYLSKYDNDKIKKIILLAPQDNINFDKLDIHKSLLEEAKNNIDNGVNDKLLSKKFLGFCLMSSETYYQLIITKDINNIPYKTPNPNFSVYNSIKKPIFIIIGKKDIGDNGNEYMKEILSNSNNTTYKILEDANHTFSNKEKELTDLIINYLQKNK